MRQCKIDWLPHEIFPGSPEEMQLQGYEERLVKLVNLRACELPCPPGTKAEKNSAKGYAKLEDICVYLSI